MSRGKIKEILYVIPLALIVGVTPLIVHYKKIKLNKVVASYWIRDYNTDFFSYYKMWAFLIFTLLALISFYIYIKQEKKIKKTFYYIPIALYMLMIVISTIFSECKETSLYGFPDRFEGMPVLLAYMLVLLIAINLLNSKRQIKFLLIILLISAVIIGIIGLYQFFGMDFSQSLLAKKLMLPASEFEEIVSKIKFRFDKQDLVYGTLYNPNYVGSYFVMLFILTFVMYLFAGKRESKVLYGAICLLMFANWLGSLSRAGIIGGIFSLFILAFLLKDELRKRWRSLFVIFICFIVVFALMDVCSGGVLRREFLSLGKETKIAMEGKTAKIQDIKNEDGFLKFITIDNQLKISFNESEKINFSDSQGNNLDYNIKQAKEDEENFIYIDNKEYKKFKFKLINHDTGNAKLLELYYGKKQANFIINPKSNSFFIIGIRGNVYPIKEVESWGFIGKERFASGRGYIWSRSLPLLKKTMIKGFGPDTYAIYFPQHDVVGKFKSLSTVATIVDKPHNMYLQIAINTGIISLIAVIILFGVYFFRSLKIYWNNDFNNWFSRAGIAIFGAFTGYAVAGIFNDSTISVAPVFWTLLGIGLMIELKLKGTGTYEV